VPVSISFVIQLVTVLAVAILCGRGMPPRLRILLSATFVSVPVWTYQPLADLGMVLLLDIVVPVLLVHELFVHSFRIQVRGVELPVWLVFVFPVLFAPLGFFFLDPAYYGYHGVLLVSVLYRCFVIAGILLILNRDVASASLPALYKFMACQFLALFVLGSLQYVAGLDLVVYERFKDTENIVDAQLLGSAKILFGLGFLGLFRGAVAQMALVGIFWWLLFKSVSYRRRMSAAMETAMYVVATVCVIGSMSRVGLVALVLVFGYIVVFIRNKSAWFFVLSGIVSVMLLLYWFPYLGALEQFTLFGARFGMEELTAQAGSGVTRVQSVLGFLAALSESVWPWICGLGGFNPIATNEHYGVFGMHGDYFDILVRYGVLPGILYLGLLVLLAWRLVHDFNSANYCLRHHARSFGALGLGVSVLALTQGALLFSGTAGYLATTHAWIAIAIGTHARRFCATDRGAVGVSPGYYDDT